jgi:hypothetical protein
LKRIGAHPFAPKRKQRGYASALGFVDDFDGVATIGRRLPTGEARTRDLLA